MRWIMTWWINDHFGGEKKKGNAFNLYRNNMSSVENFPLFFAWYLDLGLGHETESVGEGGVRGVGNEGKRTQGWKYDFYPFELLPLISFSFIFPGGTPNDVETVMIPMRIEKFQIYRGHICIQHCNKQCIFQCVLLPVHMHHLYYTYVINKYQEIPAFPESVHCKIPITM